MGHSVLWLHLVSCCHFVCARASLLVVCCRDCPGVLSCHAFPLSVSLFAVCLAVPGRRIRRVKVGCLRHVGPQAVCGVQCCHCVVCLVASLIFFVCCCYLCALYVSLLLVSCPLLCLSFHRLMRCNKGVGCPARI